MSAVRKSFECTFPQHDDTAVSVSVTPAERGRAVIDNDPAPMEFTRDPATIKQIRDNLPNAPSANLIAARHAKVLQQEAAFLADTSGTVPPPEREALIDALQFAANYILDRVVIA